MQSPIHMLLRILESSSFRQLEGLLGSVFARGAKSGYLHHTAGTPVKVVPEQLVKVNELTSFLHHTELVGTIVVPFVLLNSGCDITLVSRLISVLLGREEGRHFTLRVITIEPMQKHY